MITRLINDAGWLLLFLVAGVGWAGTSESDLHSKHFRVAVIQDFPPLYQLDRQGNPEGFAIDLLETLALKAGFSIEYLVIENWGEAAQLVSTGEADFVPGFGINDYRLTEFDFSVAMESISVRAFVKKDDRRIRKIEDLAADRFSTAVIDNGAADVELRRRGGYNLVSKNNIDEGLNALLSGAVDAFVFPEPVLLRKLRSMGLEGFVDSVDEPLITLKRGYLFRQGDEHLEVFNELLTQLIESPIYPELLNKWYGEPAPYWTVKRTIVVMLILVGILAAVLVLWRNYSVGQVNKRLRRNEKYLAATNRELEQLVYVASHDLRSPLVNVDGFSRELEYSLKDINALFDADDKDDAALEKLLKAELPEMQQSLACIRNSARQMDILIKGLLKLSRAGREAVHIVVIDMDQLMRELHSSFAFEVKEAGIELTAAALPSCRGDLSQVTQIFSNLIDNAIKYRDSNRPARIRISATVEKGRVYYRVEDNGIGIAENHLANIFELFHRLDPAAGNGEGLGLTAVKQMLARLDGDIRVESQPGRGSVFIVELPAGGTAV